MTWIWIVGAVLLLGAGALVPALLSRPGHSSDDEAIAARAKHNQLGLHVEVLPPSGDERVAALLNRARERWITAGGVLAQARTEEEYRLAERICAEGLALVKEART
ncbi:hypothetical protein KIPE111705_42000 [Kibdelosporangium persicum]|uniref:C-type cytochrome biogenesis protein CcmI n=1 Tax=Kibdelosporangium persicum TaxID=2698649 RepID=A0ABX2F061_9PSEU|nr:hypothetical protein [Kibdelosporangium persicum]NRN64669.1 hypothetical protein [Kibdelosporangium persicum]